MSRLRGVAIKSANFRCSSLYVVAQLKSVLTFPVERKTRRHVRPDSKFYPNFQHPTAGASLYASCSGFWMLCGLRAPLIGPTGLMKRIPRVVGAGRTWLGFALLACRLGSRNQCTSHGHFSSVSWSRKNCSYLPIKVALKSCSPRSTQHANADFNRLASCGSTSASTKPGLEEKAAPPKRMSRCLGLRPTV